MTFQVGQMVRFKCSADEPRGRDVHWWVVTRVGLGWRRDRVEIVRRWQGGGGLFDKTYEDTLRPYAAELTDAPIIQGE